MLNRSYILPLLIAGLTIPFIGCGNSQVDSIQLSPATQALTAGQTVQFTAAGSYGHGSHPASVKDVTALVTWTSSTPAIATISSSGLATAVSAGATTITASMPGFTGVISATATLTVTGNSGTGGSGTDVVSLLIIPGSQSVASPTQDSQFIAIGSTQAGQTQNLTNKVAWTSSSLQVASISSSGLATAVGKGSATFTAVYTNADNTVATGTATFIVVNGPSEPITALSITPSDESLSATGQTGQFIAIGTNGTTGLQEDITNSSQLTWSSSVPSIATITSGLTTGNGMAKGVSAGTSTITAVWKNPDGSVVSAPPVTVTVTLSPAPEPLLSLEIIPNSITVGDLQDTGQFLAIGTYSTPPTVRDLTNIVTWTSSFPDSFPVNTNSGGTQSASAGIVTAYGTGTAAIIAEATDPITGSIQTATASFSCPLVLPNPNGNPPTPGSCWTGQGGPLKATLTVYGEGLNTTNWLVTAASATGTPNVIHCGPGWAADGDTGGSVCTGIYPIGTTVTLTAPAQTGVAFGGWTYNCTPTAPVTAGGPNSCTVTLTSINKGSVNATVGAIFNNQ